MYQLVDDNNCNYYRLFDVSGIQKNKGAYKSKIKFVIDILHIVIVIIPLTFTLDPDKTTKLRVCTNSSFFTGKNVSLNNCMISGPSYLIPMQDILLRWRVAQECAIADIRHCYHSVDSSPLDRSLRRIHLKRGGMGSQSMWDQACFKVMRCFRRKFRSTFCFRLCREIYKTSISIGKSVPKYLYG